MPLRRLHDALVALSHVERRLEPFFREAVDAVTREPIAAAIQFLINLQRRDQGFALAEERPIPDEEAHLQAIIDLMHAQMEGRFKPGGFGILMSRNLVDDLLYNERGNAVLFVKYL